MSKIFGVLRDLGRWVRVLLAMVRHFPAWAIAGGRGGYGWRWRLVVSFRFRRPIGAGGVVAGLLPASAESGMVRVQEAISSAVSPLASIPGVRSEGLRVASQLARSRCSCW